MSLINTIKNKFIKPEYVAIDKLESSFFDEKHWHYNKSAIDLKKENQTIQLNSKADQVSYVNFLVAGTNFSRIEPYQNKIILQERNSIQIKGKKAKSLAYIIYLIEYNEQNKQIKKHNLRLNEMKSFTKQKDTVSARLAIRISGKGKMELNSIFTSPYFPVPKVKKDQVTDLKEVTIAGILSDDAAVSLSDVSSVYTLSANTWQEELERKIPDFVLMEAEQIRNGEISADSLLLWCRTSDIPVILWHRQAEIEPGQFAVITEHVQFIITHEASHVEMYREQAPTAKVELTPMPIRPSQSEKAIEEQELEKNRNILWRNNPKDFICFLLKKNNIKYESMTPTLTMYVTAHTKEEFQQAIETIEGQTVKNVKWILFIMPFEGYAQAMNQYMDHIEIHIHSYVLKHRFFKFMVPTTHFGILRKQQIQNDFFLEDIIHWLDYQPSDYLKVSDENGQITAEFYLKQTYIKKRLKELIPVEGDFFIEYNQNTYLSK